MHPSLGLSLLSCSEGQYHCTPKEIGVVTTSRMPGLPAVAGARISQPMRALAAPIDTKAVEIIFPGCFS